MNILVTGANGFVGKDLCLHLLSAGHKVRAAVREVKHTVGSTMIEYSPVGEIDAATGWAHALADVDIVVHLAARVHVMHENSDHALAAYRRVNTDATLRLAQQAAEAGVQRFIYLSSIKVNGEITLDKPFNEADLANPLDPYAVSKYEAEQGLREIERITKLEVVIIRPPLVYGPGVRGNFLRLLKLIRQGIPLPFSAIKNRRSLIYLKNLSGAIRACIEHPNAAGKLYMVSDGDPVSVSDLLRKMAWAMKSHPRLFPVPQWALRALGKVSGKSDEVSRLIDSLVVDASLITQDLQWVPRYSLYDGLSETVKWFQHTKR